MVIIGLTGGIGSGKSTVARFLAELGAVHLDGDKLGHEVYRHGSPAWQALVTEFGAGILDAGGEIDRKKLGQIVFADPKSLKRLNGIVHPLIRDLALQRLEDCRRRGVAVVVLEAAVLIEAGWTDLVDEVWVVTAAEDAVVRRVKESKGANESDTRARIGAQMSTEERKRHGLVVIENNSGLDELRAKVKEAWSQVLARHGISPGRSNAA